MLACNNTLGLHNATAPKAVSSWVGALPLAVCTSAVPPSECPLRYKWVHCYLLPGTPALDAAMQLALMGALWAKPRHAT